MIPLCKQIEDLELNKISKCTTIRNVDVDTINDTQINYCNACTNLPANAGNGFLISVRYTDTYLMQKFFSIVTKQEYTRYKENGAWEKWMNLGIVASGNNENGSYIKYGDGTMKCYRYL